jgi:methyltransferase (TIGR00027 family)
VGTNMPDMEHNLDGVAETLLIPLYVRAEESGRPDALIKDEKAEALVSRMGSAFSRIKQIRMDENDKVAIILRNRQFDRYARGFLSNHPQAVVVHIGCGLDTRFERVDDGRVQWYDLDLPEVIELRRKVIGSEEGRYHLLAGSVFESGWQEEVGARTGQSFLFLAEGVLMYFEEPRVRSLLLSLQDNFPGSEFIFDAFSPLIIHANNLRLKISRSGIGARYHWGLKRGRDLEGWSEGIRLLDEWFPFDHPEQRLAHARWIRHIPPLARAMGIYHYRLERS